MQNSAKALISLIIAALLGACTPQVPDATQTEIALNLTEAMDLTLTPIFLATITPSETVTPTNTPTYTKTLQPQIAAQFTFAYEQTRAASTLAPTWTAVAQNASATAYQSTTDAIYRSLIASATATMWTNTPTPSATQSLTLTSIPTELPPPTSTPSLTFTSTSTATSTPSATLTSTPIPPTLIADSTQESLIMVTAHAPAYLTVTAYAATLPIITSEPSLTSTPSLPPTKDTNVWGIVRTQTLNVRKCPGTSCPRAGTLREGDRVQLLGKNSSTSWVFVDTNSVQGWVRNTPELITTEGDMGGLPVKESIPLPTSNAPSVDGFHPFTKDSTGPEIFTWFHSGPRTLTVEVFWWATFNCTYTILLREDTRWESPLYVERYNPGNTNGGHTIERNIILSDRTLYYLYVYTEDGGFCRGGRKDWTWTVTVR